eukprot:169425_1
MPVRRSPPQLQPIPPLPQQRPSQHPSHPQYQHHAQQPSHHYRYQYTHPQPHHHYIQNHHHYPPHPHQHPHQHQHLHGHGHGHVHGHVHPHPHTQQQYYNATHQIRPTYRRSATSIPPRSATTLSHNNRPPKPQPQKSSTVPISKQSKQSKQIQHYKRIKFNFKNNNKITKKRSFIDMIRNENDIINNNNCNISEQQRKRRKLFGKNKKEENLSFVDECSIPYQSLINPHKWRKNQHNLYNIGKKKK